VTGATGLSRAVKRTEKGLVVAGTRITLYQILDYLDAGWTRDLLSERLRLDPVLVDDVLTWMDDNSFLLQREYAEVVAQNQKNRAYWETRNAEVLKKLGRDRDTIRAELEKRFGAKPA